MNLYSTLIAAVFLFGTVYGQFQAINLYYKPLELEEPHKLGTIRYNCLDASAEFVQDHRIVSEGLASIGFEDSTGNIYYSALGQLDSKRQKNLILHIANDHVFKVDYNLEDTVDDSNGFHVVVQPGPAKGPQPAIEAPIKLVNNKLPEPEEEKSLIQKYWFYVIPLVLMLLVSGGAQN